MSEPPAHPPELSYPCYLSILGELAEMTPHGGSEIIVIRSAVEWVALNLTESAA